MSRGQASVEAAFVSVVFSLVLLAALRGLAFTLRQITAWQSSWDALPFP